MTWNKLQHTLSTYTLNGVLIARAEFLLTGSIGCMEISMDGQNALIGVNSFSACDKANNSQFLNLKQTEDSDLESEETQDSNKLDIPLPSICFLDLHTLKV